LCGRAPGHSPSPAENGAMTMRIIPQLLLLAAFTAAAPQGFADSKEVPKTTDDGLELKTQTKHRVVYVKPGATLTQYKRFALTDCHIEFSKKWLDDYNRSQREPSRRITEDDLERARKDLAGQFRKIFTEELVKGRGQRARHHDARPQRQLCIVRGRDDALSRAMG
jgi:hypothetical protein